MEGRTERRRERRREGTKLNKNPPINVIVLHMNCTACPIQVLCHTLKKRVFLLYHKNYPLDLYQTKTAMEWDFEELQNGTVHLTMRVKGKKYSTCILNL